MASALGLLQLVLLAAGCFATGVALLTALAWPRLRPRLAAWSPAARARALRWTCAAPLAGAGILTGLCLLPSLLGLLWPRLDHCLEHPGHIHLCLIHPPSAFGGLLGWAVLGAFWGVVAAGAVAVARPALGAARSLAALWRAARYEPAVGAHLITSSLPFCAVVGWVRQKIVLSTALADALPRGLLRVVLAHEAAHVRRRDSLWLLVASLVSVAHLPWLRRALLADLALAAELACDEDAAAAIGDRLGVAEAVVFVERLLSDRTTGHGLAPAFGGSDVAVRVEALLEPGRGAPTLAPSIVGAALIGAVLALTPSSTLHHWTETLLGLFVG